MRPTSTCPEEVELLPAAGGEAVGEEVAGHLVGCEVCRGRVERLKSDLFMLREAARESSGVRAADSVAPAEKTPEKIGRYDILEALDKGGQARVYRAVHPSLRQEVVIKVGHEPVPHDEAETDWLVNEARLLCGLDHPNLARVYDLDFHEERPFLVMEYIRGRTLSQLGREGAISPKLAAGLVAKVARAVSVAHKVGVFHRDITPRNILVDENGEPHLIDFGLASLKDAWGGKAEPLGLVAGTSDYMSPEQAEGRTDRIDARTDVYGLGMVLRFLLADRSDPVASAPGLRKDTPAHLERVIEKATAKDPDQRYASAGELAAALDRAARRQLGVEWAALAILLVVAGGIGMAAAWWPRPRPASGFQDVLVRHDARWMGAETPLGAHPPVYLSVLVPKGWQALAFFVDPDGKVEVHSKLNRVPQQQAGEMDRYEHWRNGLHIGRMTGLAFVPDPPGTKMVLVMAFRKGKTAEEAKVLAGELEVALSGAWRPPTERVYKPFRISRDGGVDYTTAVSRGTTEDLDLTEAEQVLKVQLKGVKKRLDEMGVEFYVGTTFAYDGRGG